MTLPPPQPTRFIHAHHVYSAEGASVGIYALTGQQVHRLQLADTVLHLMFRHVPAERPEAPGRSYVWAVCRSGAPVWDVTDPEAPYPGKPLPPAPDRWALMGGYVDHETGAMGVVETRGLGGTGVSERRFWAFYGHPMAPARGGQAPLGMSDSNRGGVIEPLGTHAGRRLLAVTCSAQRTAVVDVTEFPFVVSESMPCFQSMACRRGLLVGTDGDAVLGLGLRPSWLRRVRRTLGLEASRWSSWGALGGTAPAKLHTLTCPGWLYDQQPTSAMFVRQGARYLLSGWTDGGEGEYVSLLRVGDNGALSHVRTPLSTHGIPAAAIDIPAPGHVAYLWGAPPYYPPTGQRHYLVPVGLPADLRQAWVGAPVELRRS